MGDPDGITTMVSSRSVIIFGLYELAAFWSQIVFVQADFRILFDLTLDGLA